MKALIVVVTAIISFNIYAAEESDVYLTRAGWQQQSGGWVDPGTNLIWGPEIEKMSWGEAKSYCSSLKLGGKSSWRLPTVSELQSSVCKSTNYKTRTPCPQPRDHQKDLWLLVSDKETTYWASNIIPGDPYNAYYFMVDVEGQYIMTSKGDKSKARCVTENAAPAAVATAGATGIVGAAGVASTAGATGTIPAAGTTPATATTTAVPAIISSTPPKRSTFYIAPMIGIGGFFTREITISNSPFLNGELRGGIRLSDDFMLFMSADTGVNTRGFTFPVLTTGTIGPEYFIAERISLFAAIGGGILTVNRSLFTGQTAVRDTSGGLSWKAGVTWQMIKWGDRGQYNIPISITYTGIRTSLVICHTALVSLGFMYFN